MSDLLIHSKNKFLENHLRTKIMIIRRGGINN
jgi:hypothetical protein